MRRHPVKVGLLVAAVIALVAFAAMASGLFGAKPAPPVSSGEASPAVPALPSSAPVAPKSSGTKTVVNISLTDSGGPKGVGTGPMHPNMMGMTADKTTVPHGRVSFRVTNAGAVKHEMVILPIAASGVIGTRPFDDNARVDEAGSLGEAEGMAPDASGSVTVTLAPGQYELVCNYKGHYVSGMYAKLTVT
jgi:uncharacterized cupredoxin-like copper-binding protein